MKISPLPAGTAQNAWLQASAAAGCWCSVVLLVSVPGILIAQGHDGLAYTLGIGGAAFLWATLIVPVIAGSPAASSIPAYLSSRCASATTGAISSFVLLTALAGLLAAELTATAGLVRLIGGNNSTVGFVAALMLAAFGLTAAIHGTRVASSASAALVPAIVGTVVIVLVLISPRDGPGALISIPAIADITSLEQTLLEKRLADPAIFKPHAVPFLRTDALNFGMLVTCLSLGLALLASPRLNPATAEPFSVSKLAGRALMLVVGIIVLLPPLAAAAKRALLALFASGVRPAALPEWMNSSLQAGMLQICGSTVTDPIILTKACGKGVGQQGLIRWHEAIFAPDALLFAGIQSASSAASILIAAVAGLAVIATFWTSRRIATLAMGGTGAPATTAAIYKPCLVVLAAAVIAYAKPADAVTLMTWSASLAAAALAPTMIAAIFARNPSVIAANTAILTGAIITVAVILAARYAPVELAGWSNALASAPSAVTRKLASLQDAWAAAAEGPGKDALRAQAEKLARDNLSWFGVKPMAAGIFGLALGCIIVLIGTVLSSIGWRKPSN